MDSSRLPIVTNEQLFDKNKLHRYGLLSEQIFGPIKNKSCQCGLYTGFVSKNKRCPECGVLCSSPDLRYTTFARSILNIPVVNPMQKELLKKICRDFPNILEPIQSDLLSNNPLYLTEVKSDIYRLANTFDKYNSIPLAITGIFSLFIGLKYISSIYGSQPIQNIIDTCFTREILIVPPQARPVIKENGKIIRDELNDIYTRMIGYNNYIGREFDSLEIDWRELVDNYINAIVSAGDEIFEDPDLVEYDRFFSKLQYYVDELYASILKKLSGKQGLIRSQFISRTIDFSARAVIVPNPSLKAYEVIISKKIFLKLFMVEFLYWLSQNGYIKNYANLMKCVQNTEYITNYIDQFEEFIDWFFVPGNVDVRKRFVLANRQPTLWRYGLSCVEIVNVSDDDVIQLSPLILEQFNADFDGDRMAIYKLHDDNALEDLETFSYNKNIIKYEHNDEMLHRVRLEAVFAFNIIFNKSYPLKENCIPIEVDNVSELDDNFAVINHPIKIGNKTYSYGLGLINKWCNFSSIVITDKISTENLSRILYKFSKSKDEYHNRLHNLNIHLYWFVALHPEHKLTFPLDPIMYNNTPIKQLLHKLPNNPIIGHAIYKGLIDRLYNEAKELDAGVSSLLGTKLNKTQLARSIASIGYIADDKNIVQHHPVISNILAGVDENDFFESSIGTRKGILDKHDITPKSGYLERSLVMNLSTVDIDMADCKSTHYFPIELISEQHKTLLYGRWYYDPKIDQLCEFNELTAKKFVMGDTIQFRSPITCVNSDYRICRRCFGSYDLTSPFVGILSGQYISERLTQLSMRSFHTSGSCSVDVNFAVQNFIKEHLIDLQYFDNKEILRVIFNIKIPDDILVYFKEIFGFISSDWNSVLYQNNISTKLIKNPDIGATIQKISRVLNGEPRNPQPIESSYNTLMSELLKVGNIYSCFIETILCNLYECQSGRIYRYELEYAKSHNIKPSKIILKYNIKKLFKKISKVLGLLYEPNRTTIKNIGTLDELSYQTKNIYEQLWLGLF